MTDPVTGQTVCSCQLTPSLAVSYPRLAALPESLYGSAAAYSAQALMASSPFAAAAAAASNGSPDGSLYSPFATVSEFFYVKKYDFTVRFNVKFAHLSKLLRIVDPYKKSYGIFMPKSQTTRESLQCVPFALVEGKNGE